MKKKILINASNLHSGGGVQVAASFLYELTKINILDKKYDVHIYVSDEVDKNLNGMGASGSDFQKYEVINIHGIRSLLPKYWSIFSGYDLVFTIFGPFYFPFSLKFHVIGFAQAWIIYPNNVCYSLLSFIKRQKLWMKFELQWIFFKLSDHYIVELEHVKSALITCRDVKSSKISLVRNAVSDVFLDHYSTKKSNDFSSTGRRCIKLGIVSRAYLHKNLDFLGSVMHELSHMSTVEYQLYVTLNESEWKGTSNLFKKYARNVGVLDIAQCPEFYESIDAVVFPSLLESFSATPIEAMIMRRPLFASDLSFVRDCCGHHAIYFDPSCPNDCAVKIIGWFEKKGALERNAFVNSAGDYALSLPTSLDRALSYVGIIDSFLESQERKN
jgi:glycosyltransferase involved in cell wall biosynthesis